jgi:hypothetical protein
MWSVLVTGPGVGHDAPLRRFFGDRRINDVGWAEVIYHPRYGSRSAVDLARGLERTPSSQWSPRRHG